MRTFRLRAVAAALASIGLASAGLVTWWSTPASADTPFTVSAQVLANGPCDVHAELFIQAGPFDPGTRVGVTVDYPGGQHEGANDPAGVNGEVSLGFSQSTSLLIGGTTTINVFLDSNLDLQPDPGSPVATTTVTYCPPPTSPADCKNGGWQNYPNLGFKNQGDCVSFVETGGRNPPA